MADFGDISQRVEDASSGVYQAKEVLSVMTEHFEGQLQTLRVVPPEDARDYVHSLWQQELNVVYMIRAHLTGIEKNLEKIAAELLHAEEVKICE